MKTNPCKVIPWPLPAFTGSVQIEKQLSGRFLCFTWMFIPLGILLTACSSSPELTEKQMMTTRMGDTAAVEILDMRSVMRNNVLTAQVSVKNWGPKADKSGAEQVDTKLYSYRFKWLNANGMVVFSDEAWKPLTLTRDQSADILGIAPNPDATTFRFEIHQYK